jgi:hypothetical protein
MSAYHVELGAGCHGNVDAPVVSRHRSWDLAKRAALKSDRFVAVNSETGERFQIPQQNDRTLGWGRYGNGLTVGQARAAGII